MTEYAFEGAKRASTTVTWSFGTQTLQGDAAFSFSNPISAQYQETVRAAFARWASASGLMFQEVPDAATVDVRLGFGVFSNRSTVGETWYSYARGILAPDTVVRLLDPSSIPLVADAQGDWVYGLTRITLYQVVLHEIGHALGLNHTTDPVTNLYPVATTQNLDLATGDIEGINALYPLYIVAALDPVQAEGDSGGLTNYHFAITRYSDPAYAITVQYSVTGSTYPGLAGTSAADAAAFAGGAFPSGQITFAAGSSTATLTVAVAGNSLAQPDQGFSIALVGTTRGTTSAVILDDDGSAAVDAQTVGVYRFFDAVDGTHFFTASQQERNVLIATRADFTYEGPGFEAVADPAADAAATPVFRFFDSRFGTHFYTASLGERDTAAAGRPDLVYEGMGFYEHAAPQSGDTPVYRFFDSLSGTHFYTSSAAERATVLATRPTLVDEGVGFYAPSAT